MLVERARPSRGRNRIGERQDVVRRLDVIVVGAGIVGLATARALAERQPGLRLAVLEKETGVGRHQTGHNSGVIHSGIYYRPGSRKATSCVEGARRLKAFCDRHAIPRNDVGKVIVAGDETERDRLRELHRRGVANGVAGLQWIDAARLAELEPHVRGVAALHSPQTGITDFRLVAQALGRELEAREVEIVFGARVLDVERSAEELHVQTQAGEFSAGGLVNCAGLHADRVARACGAALDVRIVPFRGAYLEVSPSRRRLVRGLVYPVPDPAFPFLGVHLTPTIDGRLEAGPNAVLALAREGYRASRLVVGELADVLAWPGFWKLAARHWRMGLVEWQRTISRRAFARALQRLVPELKACDLEPCGAGVRAQAVARDGTLLDDYVIVESERALHVLSAPSPAATACLAIGDHLADWAEQRLGL
jgi:L-2-hydroxyglutarate oxidase LhgO